jgi:hypothetical protein
MGVCIVTRGMRGANIEEWAKMGKDRQNGEKKGKNEINILE